MPSLKSIRSRIVSAKSNQKITRAMKMVAAARLTRAQQRILALRPYAVKAQEVLSAVVTDDQGAEGQEGASLDLAHPLLVRRPEQRILYLVLTSDRGLCGSFNTNVLKATEQLWRVGQSEGREVSFYVVGRKGRDALRRRGAPLTHVFSGVWEKLDHTQAHQIVHTILTPFRHQEVDAIYIVYNHFKSVMTQEVTVQPLLPLRVSNAANPESKSVDMAIRGAAGEQAATAASKDYLFEPSRHAILNQLVPMYLELTVLRALYESYASELGAKMTAMDAATKNAKEMISALTLQYNRARQAAITKELMEITGGAEALKE